MKKTLDFIVIGAAKSGTTALFELAKNHPELSMPRDKEVPFFSENEIHQKGMKWYLNTYFRSASSDSLWGTATPQYMLGQGSVSPKKIADRIKQDAPSAKLVAILREPVARAFSHYQMLAQRGHFTKSFEDATAELLANNNLDKLRYTGINDSNAFVLGGEYGRILQYYYDKFPPQQILVLFTEDLKANPEKTLRKLFTFLGVDSSYVPETIGQEFRKGSSDAKVKLLTPGVIFRVPFVKKVWKNYMPYPLRKKVEYSINLWNTRAHKSNQNVSAIASDDLKKLYKNDRNKLETLTGIKGPWPST